MKKTAFLKFIFLQAAASLPRLAQAPAPWKVLQVTAGDTTLVRSLKIIG